MGSEGGTWIHCEEGRRDTVKKQVGAVKQGFGLGAWGPSSQAQPALILCVAWACPLPSLEFLYLHKRCVWGDLLRHVRL